MIPRSSGKAFRHLGEKPLSFTFQSVQVQGAEIHMVSVPSDQLWRAVVAWDCFPKWANWDNGHRTPVQHGRNLKGNRIVVAGGATYEELIHTRETADVQG